jgi:hypothetical protein
MFNNRFQNSHHSGHKGVFVMKKRYLSLFLMFLPWAATCVVAFFGGYVEDGTNGASRVGLLISVFCGVFTSFAVSLYLAVKLAKTVLRRIVMFCLLMVAVSAGAIVLPAPARACVWGQVIRLRRELPMELLRSTAASMKRKRDMGILRTTGPEERLWIEGDTFVDKSELPAELQHKIEYVTLGPQFLRFAVNRRVDILYPLVPLPVFQLNDFYRIADNLYLSMR